MESKQLGAGDPIESRCTKCRAVTNHIIIAMKDDVPAKVECNTCGGQHLYRKPKADPKPAAKKATTTKKAGTSRRSDQKKWLDLQEQLEGQEAHAYSMDAEYKVDTVIKHPTFGLGLVQNLLGSRKMEVLFEDGLRVMRCK